MVKLLLFDLDWTVIYTGGAGVFALDHAFLELYGIREAMKRITPDGKTDPAIVREMIRVHLNRDAQDGEIERVCAAYVARLPIEVAAAEGYRVLPGIPELLEALSGKTGVRIGLGTGNLEGGAHAKLARCGLMRYFEFGGYATDSEDRPEVLRAAVRRGERLVGERAHPRDVVVIGDHFRDVLAGQAIGATTLGVATGHLSVKDLSAYNPDHVLPDLSDTEKVLDILLTAAPLDKK
jgi:phosphoglycolate phosphatase